MLTGMERREPSSLRPSAVATGEAACAYSMLGPGAYGPLTPTADHGAPCR